jgi:hypothetical protein
VGYESRKRKALKTVKNATLTIDAYHQPFNNACGGKLYKCTPISDMSRIPNEAGYA